ncbi:MAG: hypothetical protein ABEJ28_02205 [Salinigranum sp.]
MPRSRRSVLQASAAATIPSVVGCLGFGGTNETIDVGLENDDGTAHELAVTIDFEGETIFEHAATLEAGESTGGSFENPKTAGSARVKTTLDDRPPTTESVGVGPATGIRSVNVTITENGDLLVQATRT